VTFTVRIDAARCQGHGKCVLEAPEIFDADEQGYAVLTEPEFPNEMRASAQQCVDDCPEGALSIQG
jgi:ferredoxin